MYLNSEIAKLASSKNAKRYVNHPQYTLVVFFFVKKVAFIIQFPFKLLLQLGKPLYI